MNNKYRVDGFKLTEKHVEAMSFHSSKPDFPEYQLLSERIKSFIDNGWPKYLKQTPLEMSMAGFFYTGKDDRTICFNCSGGLMRWRPGEDPFVHHANWYKHCSYIQAIRPMSERETQQNVLKRPHPIIYQDNCKRKKNNFNFSVSDIEF